MADIIFRYPAMRTAADEIAGLSNEYKQAASTFETEMLNAIAPWEGASNEKFKQFITVPVREYVQETVPNIVMALSEMLKANAEQMEKADQHIAQNIPSTLGG